MRFIGAQIVALCLATASWASLDPPVPTEAPKEIIELASQFIGALQRGDRALIASATSIDFEAHFAAEHELGANDQILRRDAFLDRALNLATWQCPFELAGAAKEPGAAKDPKLYWIEFKCSKTMVAPHSRIQIRDTRLTLRIVNERRDIAGIWVVWKLPDDVPYPIEP